MRKIKIGFREQAKAVVAEVDVEYEDENKDPKEVLLEAQELYNEAQKFSKMKTIQK